MKLARAVVILIVTLFAYVLSSGPVLATAFLLRETTKWDGFYGVLYVYYPLLAGGHGPVSAYIEWWVKLFGTVGPG
jgi:hypothetical protein